MEVTEVITANAVPTAKLKTGIHSSQYRRTGLQDKTTIVVAAEGNFDAGTLEVLVSHAGLTSAVVTTTLTADGIAEIDLPNGFEVSAQVVGATTAPAVNVVIAK